MTGAEYIAEFLNYIGSRNIFLINGGACAFIVDAIHNHKNLKYTCFQHEQACAMAADAVWRVNKKVGVTVVTSGPGATNLVTGIACSYFDSIPSIHITGNVNQTETSNFLGANVRQAGFQETKIVEMITPITKYAVQVKNADDLKKELEKAFKIAISDRKGPVLIDVPMNVQKQEVGEFEPFNIEIPSTEYDSEYCNIINNFFQSSKRPLVLFGAGVGLAGVEKEVENWLKVSKIPFVTSWNGCTYFNHYIENFCGKIGVYGDRSANLLIQNCDKLLVLGSRLDNRQRSGNVKNFALSAEVLVVDVDIEELKKYKNDGYKTLNANLKDIQYNKIDINKNEAWSQFTMELKSKYFCKDISTFSAKNNTLSPYLVMQKINQYINDDAILVCDIGAHGSWFFQSIMRKNQTIFTNGGHGAMGYALPAAIGSAISMPDKQIIAFVGDGCMQMNIQELQTIQNYNLNIKIVLFNNSGYGIIKQFQDLYFEGRHAATGEGYSVPDFEKISKAYGFEHFAIHNIDDLKNSLFSNNNSAVIELILHPNTMIEPKLELGKPIHDQYPYMPDEEFETNSKYCKNTRKSLQ